jgi:predicted transcriptional regulator
MSTKVASPEMRRVTVTLPEDLLNRLDMAVPRRERSAFIARAIEEQLAIEGQVAAIEEAAGCWSDEAHPDMKTEGDIDRWLAELRRPWNERFSALGLSEPAAEAGEE